MNDDVVCEQSLKILGEAGKLERYTREGREASLFMAYSDIERAARRAQDRLNELRYSKEKKNGRGN